MKDLASIGLSIGQTVTAEMIEAASGIGLPAAALAELWERRTINKQAIAAIEDAIKADTKPTRTKTKKEPDTENGNETREELGS